MYNIGDMVVYGLGGVMKIVDVRDIDVGDTARSYYVLRELSGYSSSETLIPVDNAELVAQMRPLLTKDEIAEVIRAARLAPDPEWIEDNRRRAEHFKSILLSGDRVALLLMIRSIVDAGRRRADEGKKNFLSDENAMKKAEKLLYSEISIVLGIAESDVPAYIENVA